MDCREYQGSLSDGYGDRRGTVWSTRRVHRQIMEMAGHDIKGKVVMHTCDNPACFLYEHLRLGTQAENMADMASKGRHARSPQRTTHCKNGHEYDASTTYIRPGGARMCRPCMAASTARCRARKAGA